MGKTSRNDFPFRSCRSHDFIGERDLNVEIFHGESYEGHKNVINDYYWLLIIQYIISDE